MTAKTSTKTGTKVRKKNTGEPGNGGEFGTIARSESTLGLDADETALPGTVLPETVFTKRYESVDDKIAAFKDELSKGVDALADDAEWHDFLDTMGKFHHYSFQNQMLIRLQNPEASKVAGFRKWQELDRNVIKGQKAISILAPKIANVAVKDAAGSPLRGPDGKPLKERRCVGFTTASVFDVSQTEGKDLPDPQPNLTETPPDGYAADLTEAIESEGFTVSYEPVASGGGYTSPAEKKVVIRADASPASQAKTLAHELGHIKAGHLERMGEYHSGHGGCRGEMEVEAESIAYVLSRANGMSADLNQNTSRYLNSWSAGGTSTEHLDTHRKAIAASSETVAKTVKALLSERTWRNA